MRVGERGVNGLQAAETDAADQVISRIQTGFVFHPADEIVRDEIGVRIAAGEIVMAGLVIQIGNEKAGGRRNFSSGFEIADDRWRVHRLEVNFRVEKNGDAFHRQQRGAIPNFPREKARGAFERERFQRHGFE